MTTCCLPTPILSLALTVRLAVLRGFPAAAIHTPTSAAI